MLISFIKEFLLDIFFPKTCLSCGREGNWLCEDCIATLDIQNWCLCPVCQKRVLDYKTCKNCRKITNLTGLFTPLSFENPLIKKIIHQFKYEPFLKELKEPLSYIIISHLNLIELPRTFFLKEKGAGHEFLLIPVPLHKSRLRWRGYNQAEEIAKELSKSLDLQIENNCLIRRKSTTPQTELTGLERKENIKGIFVLQNPERIKGRKIFLVDDVYTTGATLEECARVLKDAGAREVWGLVVARG
jgi:ComF family protein